MIMSEATVLRTAEFDEREMDDIFDAATERGITVGQLIHDAVMNDIFR